MNNVRIRVVITVIAFVTVLLCVGCGPGPQNENQNHSQNRAQANTNGNKPNEPCDETTLPDKLDKLKKKLERDLGGPNGLGSMVTVTPYIVNDAYIQVDVKGSLHGADRLDDLAKILKPALKEGCVMRVLFFPTQSKQQTSTTQQSTDETQRSANDARFDGFEWTCCDPPSVPCDNGMCASPCPQRTPGDTNTSTNSNANRSNQTSP